MESSRIMIANSMFFLVIVGLAYFIVQEERRIPERPDIEGLEQMTSRVGSTDAATENANQFGSFGQKGIFDTIIERPPTPTPAPSPTPAPPPIDKVVQYWQLSGVLDDLVFFQDMKTSEDFSIKKGEPRSVRFGNDSYNIYLEYAKLKEGKAIIYMKDMGQIQKKEYKMW